ncbi:hypothetical protein LIA77_02665 [Sarocladium implicatum]|nr:hypothetical protein LIA77_02665 [Sarocladium implicatum]
MRRTGWSRDAMRDVTYQRDLKGLELGRQPPMEVSGILLCQRCTHAKGTAFPHCSSQTRQEEAFRISISLAIAPTKISFAVCKEPSFVNAGRLTIASMGQCAEAPQTPPPTL